MIGSVGIAEFYRNVCKGALGIVGPSDVSGTFAPGTMEPDRTGGGLVGRAISRSAGYPYTARLYPWA